MKYLIERKEYIEKLFSYKDKGIIKVVTGLRSSGKATLLAMFRHHLISNGVKLKQNQLYNYELLENYLNKSWDTIYFNIKKDKPVDKSYCSQAIRGYW